MRQRQLKKEDNKELQKLKQKEAEELEAAQKKSIGIKKEEPAVGTYTFDSYGKILPIRAAKVDKLPKIMEDQPKVVERKPGNDEKFKKRQMDLKKIEKVIEPESRLDNIFEDPSYREQIKKTKQTKNQFLLPVATMPTQTAKEQSSNNSLQMHSDLRNKNNFDMKNNLKANCGVVFSEGASYINQGPTYEEQLNIDDLESIRYSIKDYQQKYQANPIDVRKILAA